jgi:hypothetical protein
MSFCCSVPNSRHYELLLMCARIGYSPPLSLVASI